MPNFLAISTRVLSMTQNQHVVSDIADAMSVPPPDVMQEYVDICVRAAQHLDSPVSFASSGDSFSSTQMSLQNTASAARNNVLAIVDMVTSFVSRAKNAGFSSPNNPFSTISSLKTSGTPATAEQADAIVSDIKTYFDLMKQETEGKLDLGKNVYRAAQLASVSFGLSGFGSIAATSVDLMKFVPDNEMLKKQKAQDILASLDFRKRAPKVVFTAEYSPDSQNRGIIVGWKRIADASGYVVKRHSVFENKDDSFTLKNDDVRSSYENVREYVKTWILSFYDNIDENGVWTFLDTTAFPDQYYIYRVQAFQVQNEEHGAIFNVDSIPSNLSFAQRRVIEDQVANTGVSPYPFIAQQIFGDTTYDWLVAGVNVRKSVNRGDDTAVTRSYSYLGSDLEFLFSQMDAGNFVIPKDVNDVVGRINNGVSKFGITQVMIELMQDTGVLSFFEGVDPRGPSSPFTSLDPVLTSNFVSGIVSSIDPETATLDLETFSVNFPKILKGTSVRQTRLNVLSQVSPSIASKVEARPQEIVVPVDNSDVQGVQFFDSSAVFGSVVDLTTFSGLSVFLKTIRMFSDENQPKPVVVGEPQATPTVSARTLASTALVSAPASQASTVVSKSSVLSSRARLLSAVSGSS